MKRILLLTVIVLAGCSTQLPPKPAPCEVIVNGQCRSLSASEKNGAGSRGHSQDPKEKIMLYHEPEVIFKDEHTPGTCRSPFR